MSTNNSRIDREKKVVELMIRIYCRRKEGNSDLCEDCTRLLEYAKTRLSKCPFGEAKTTCQHCKVHCYKPDMREKMRAVMRYSGPRMLIYHPIEAIRHLLAI